MPCSISPRRLHHRRRVRQLLRLGRHVPQAAGADDDPAGHLPRACPIAFGGCRRWSRWGWASTSSATRLMWAGDRRWACSAWLLGCLFVLPVGGADVPIVISLLNAFTGLTVAASGYVLGNTLLLVAGTLVGASGTILTRMMAKAMGRSVANTLFGALQGGSTAGWRRGIGPAGPIGRARGRRDPARLRQQGHHRARLRARGRPGAAHDARAGRGARRRRASRSTTGSTRSPAGCPAT